MNPALNSARLHFWIVSLLLLLWDIRRHLGAESAVPVAVHETSWNSATRGKTSGPIQFRYRLKEREGRAFNSKFLRVGLGTLQGWKMDLVEDGLKQGTVPGSSKPIKSDSSSSLLGI